LLKADSACNKAEGTGVMAYQETIQQEKAPMATKAKAKKKHFVAVPKVGGGHDMYRLKDWLRKNPESNPTGSDPGNRTSHQLRDALKKEGWTVREVVVCFKAEA
jgi:hypothetical protein